MVDQTVSDVKDHPEVVESAMDSPDTPSVAGVAGAGSGRAGAAWLQARVGRIPVVDVRPSVDGGRWPAKAVVGEQVPITAVVFREGHDAVAATAVLTDPDGNEHTRVRMKPLEPGTDRYGAVVVPDREGSWSYHVEGWSDAYGTWEHDAVIKISAGVDIDLMLEEGARVLELSLAEPGHDEHARSALHDAVSGLRDGGRPAQARLAAGTSLAVHQSLSATPLRGLVTPSPPMRLTVQRRRALVGSWYELFPRSEGAWFDESDGTWHSGTFRTASERLPAVAEMGFDIVYLPPIHPIGRVNRKGPNNTLDPGPQDPGSPWAIGADEGGHDAVHPDLGTVEDLDYFVERARSLNMEVGLDLALQCAPDHPWARDHPEWFTTRADGSIAYAENPPKKYQDIYPLNFENDPEGLAQEILRIVRYWISHDIKVFRVDNPHTKPVAFWEWLIGVVNTDHPDVIFLAEAFTRPAMMHTLAKVGFTQSYTYFTWRTSRQELTEYITELSGDAAAYMRPNFWPNTPDILHAFLQYGGPPAFRLRAVLATTLTPVWGVYAGYELCEHVARPGAEEYLDNEKYQLRPRDWDGALRSGRSLAPYLRRLNQIRREHPALQQLRGTTFHAADDDHVLVYSRRLHLPQDTTAPGADDDTLIVVVNLDPHAARQTTVRLNMPALGMDWHDGMTVQDLLTDEVWHWGEHNFVRLDPFVEPAHILHVRRS